MKHIKIKYTTYIMKNNDVNELLAEINIWSDEFRITILDKKNYLKIWNYIIENELLKSKEKESK